MPDISLGARFFALRPNFHILRREYLLFLDNDFPENYYQQ
jgi:hypothetical protein